MTEYRKSDNTEDKEKILKLSEESLSYTKNQESKYISLLNKNTAC